MAWGMILGALRLFEQRFADPGPLRRSLACRVFLIYVIHPPVLVAVTLSVRSVAAPALLKIAVVGPVACLLCYLCAGLLLRVSTVQRTFWTKPGRSTPASFAAVVPSPPPADSTRMPSASPSPFGTAVDRTPGPVEMAPGVDKAPAP